MDTNNLSPEDEFSKAFISLKNQLLILYSQGDVNFLFPVIAACCLAFVLRDVAPALNLYIWLSLVVIHSLSRYLLLWQFRRHELTPHNAARWLTRFISTVIISGALWGAAGIFLVPYGNNIEFTLYNGLTVLVICGLVSGALISYSINIWVLIAYSFPALIPPAIYLIAIGDRYNSAFGGFILLYYFFISVAAARMHGQFDRFMEIEQQQKELQFKYQRLKATYSDFRRHLKI